VTTAHDTGCPRQAGPHTDAARRCSDAVNLHLAAQGFDAAGKWVALALDDGSGDGTLYDSQAAAARHHRNSARHMFFVPIRPGGLNPCQAESVMATHRKLRKAGFTLGDPDARKPRLLIPRLTIEDQMRQEFGHFGRLVLN
jgi:hypothetical protein